MMKITATAATPYSAVLLLDVDVDTDVTVVVDPSVWEPDSPGGPSMYTTVCDVSCIGTWVVPLSSRTFTTRFAVKLAC